ncbi:transducin beta-like protein [Anaeramoeba ignava]|uniref:Transducin beta-like protein n=1 Tax=Anaeramoeba ignava TaxID=1746090 RepID=A0A9Q0R5H9_ANAIG|nr:transducin beta-like protein [Anaeramoeba ignava]
MKQTLKTIYKPITKMEPIYMGGKLLLSHDQNQLISSCGETVTITTIKSSKVEKIILDDAVMSIALRPDDKEIITANRHNILERWELREPDLEKKEGKKNWISKGKWKGHDSPILDITFDPSGRLLASGSADQTVRVWHVEKQIATHNLRGHQNFVSKVMFHPDPNSLILFSASEDSSFKIWDLRKKKCIKTFSNHVNTVSNFSVSNDFKFLYVSGRDKIVTKVNLQSLEVVKIIPIFESIEAVISLPNEKFITAGDKGKLSVWDSTKSKKIKEQKISQITQQNENDPLVLNEYNSFVYAFLRDKFNQIVAVTNSQNILFFDLDSFDFEMEIVGFIDEILDVKYINENESAVVSNSEQVKIFDIHSNHCVSTLYGHTDIVLSMDISYDKKKLITGSKDKTIRIWDLSINSNENINENINQNLNQNLNQNSNQNQNQNQNQNLSKFFPKAPKCLGTCSGHTEPVTTVAFPNNSNSFAISGGNDKTIKIWDLEKMESKKTIQAHKKEINSIAISPNDKLFATCSQDRTIKIWDLEKMELIGILEGHRRGIWSIAFSPVDKVIASCSADGTIKIWSLNNFMCLKTFEGHSNSVTRVRFLTHGMQILSTSSDGLIKIWSIKTNECISTFAAINEKTWCLDMNHDEEEFISGGSDSFLIVWKNYTLIEEEEKLKNQEIQIMKEQQLNNLMHLQNYEQALDIALDLNFRYKALDIFNQLIQYQNSLSKVVSKFDEKKLVQVLNLVEILKALIPYSERHFQRMDKLHRESFIIDHTLYSVKLTNLKIDEEKTNLSINSDQEI